MDLDVIIVGGGTAGAATATACARRGLRVLMLEAARLDAAGARWLNGVPGWAFREAGLDLPQHPELHGGQGRFHFIAGWGPERLVVRAPEGGSPVLEVDMARLVARLHAEARAAGADLRQGARVESVEALGPAHGRVRLADGAVFDAPTVVIAGGHRRFAFPGDRPVDRADLCVAAQELREVRDLQAARAWREAQGGRSGDVLCFTGVAGGYSIVNVRVDDEHGRVAILTGSVPGSGPRGSQPAGRVLLDRFAAQHPWVGPRLQGGARAIPLRRPRALLGWGPVARIGDAAGQVFAMHGSGIGAQLVAASLLAQTLAAGGRPWDYGVAWHRRWGGLYAASEAFATHTRRLTPSDMAEMMRVGLMSEALLASGLEQRTLEPPLHVLPAAGLAALRAPGRALDLAPTLLRMRRLDRHGRRYPDDPGRLQGWEDRRTVLAATGRSDEVGGLPGRCVLGSAGGGNG